MDLARRYPLLHRPDRWEWASITMTFTDRLPRDELIASTHVVGFVGDEVVLCRDERADVWFLPGGTREPGESVDDSLARELREEAGARLLGPFHRLGAHVGVSDASHPYRPHLPHPEKAWLWGWADVEIVGPPTNPGDGEQVTEVKTFGVIEAARRATSDNLWGGELIWLAAEQRERQRL
jgi:8-oxo-dGTP diphosphatase